MQNLSNLQIRKEGIYRTNDHPCAIFNAVLDSDGEMLTAIADMKIHSSIPKSHFDKFLTQFKDAKVCVIDSGMGVENLVYVT